MPNNPTGRALELLSLLQSHRLWGSAELAARLEVTERTVRRDVDRLRELGYPVDAEPGRHGGYRLAAGTHLPPLILGDDEAVAVAIGLRHAAEAAIEGMEDTALRALTKIEQLLPHRLRRRVSALHASVALPRRPGGDDRIDPESLSVLAAACRDHECVRLGYRRDDGEVSSRLVEPHHLVAAGRRWYLVAFDHLRHDWRTLRLDRIRDPRAAGRHFEPRALPGGDAAAMVAVAPMQTATVVIHVPFAEVADTMRWVDHTALALAGDRSTVLIRSEDVGRLSMAVARIALAAPITVLDPPALAESVRRLAGHLV
jgi:predicted DNA-binding transcriptional regulator YafY